MPGRREGGGGENLAHFSLLARIAPRSFIRNETRMEDTRGGA